MSWVHPGMSFLGGSFIPTLPIEIVGIAVTFMWAIPTSLVTFWAIDKLVGVRVSNSAEICGLDIEEHGIAAYPEFSSKGSYAEVGYVGPISAPVEEPPAPLPVVEKGVKQ